MNWVNCVHSCSQRRTTFCTAFVTAVYQHANTELLLCRAFGGQEGEYILCINLLQAFGWCSFCIWSTVVNILLKSRGASLNTFSWPLLFYGELLPFVCNNWRHQFSGPAIVWAMEGVEAISLMDSYSSCCYINARSLCCSCWVLYNNLICKTAWALLQFCSGLLRGNEEILNIFNTCFHNTSHTWNV